MTVTCSTCTGDGRVPWGGEVMPLLVCPSCAGKGWKAAHAPREAGDPIPSPAPRDDTVTLRAGIEALHGDNGYGWCQGCGLSGGAYVAAWPCPTIALLGAVPAPTATEVQP